MGNAGHIEMKIELGAEGANIHVHTALMHSHYEGVDLLQPLQYGLRNARVGVSNLFLYKTGLTGVCNVAPAPVVTTWNSLPPTPKLRFAPTERLSPSNLANPT